MTSPATAINAASLGAFSARPGPTSRLRAKADPEPAANQSIAAAKASAVRLGFVMPVRVGGRLQVRQDETASRTGIRSRHGTAGHARVSNLRRWRGAGALRRDRQ